MTRINLLSALLLSITGLAACGLKGELYEPEPTAEPESVVRPEPAPDLDKGERRTIPREPEPAQSK